MKPEISLRRLLLVIGIAAIALAAAAVFFSVKEPASSPVAKNIPASYRGNIVKDAQENTNFRQVLFTGLNSQLIVMSIPPGGEVGRETHKYTEQTLFFLSGTGKGELNGKEFPVFPGDVVVVVPGTDHNFWNTGTQDLKIYTVYAPPNHIDGLVEATKAIADLNAADEAIGEKAPVCAR